MFCFGPSSSTVALFGVSAEDTQTPNSGIAGYWEDVARQNFDFYSEELVQKHPATRYSHTAITDSEQRRVVVALGYFYDHKRGIATWLADTWAFSAVENAWQKLHDPKDTRFLEAHSLSAIGPSARYGHAAVKHGRDMILYGGTGDWRDVDMHLHSGLWMFGLDTSVWREVAPKENQEWPSMRAYHVMSVLTDPHDSTRSFLFVYGGLDLDEVWLYDMRLATWRRDPDAPTGPGVRHGASSSSLRNKAYVYGGGTRSPRITVKDDIWVYTLFQGWELFSSSFPSPPGRNYLSMAMFSFPLSETRSEDSLLIFGGANCTGSCICRDDAWIYFIERQYWAPVVIPEGAYTPANRYHQTISFIEGSFYLFGGESYRPIYMYHNSMSKLTLGDLPLGHRLSHHAQKIIDLQDGNPLTLILSGVALILLIMIGVLVCYIIYMRTIASNEMRSKVK